MIATLTFLLALASPSPSLTIQPWTGRDLTATTNAAAKYRLIVQGKPKTRVSLRATGVASGWLAAFCLPNLCSPERVNVSLDSSGQAVIQFELIREADDAPKSSGAKIVDADGAFVRVPAASR